MKVWYCAVMAIMASVLVQAHSLSHQSCQGRLLNPITDINWAMVFPIRIAGVKFQYGRASAESPRTALSPLCFCDSPTLGLPVPGLSVTVHQPLFVEEIVKTPGCLSSLGGISILPGYAKEQSEFDEQAGHVARWQVHWYVYPLFALLNLFDGMACFTTQGRGFSVAYLSEIDPTWQDDEWNVVYAPEAALFANQTAQSACALDAISATSGHPQDDLFWCAGSWGSIYPLTGNANAVVGRLQSAQLVGAKLIARLAKLGQLWRTVGQDTLCHKQPMRRWVKSEFALDPVYPTVSRSAGMPIGAAPVVWGYHPALTYPHYENINQVIFQEVQCCIRP